MACLLWQLSKARLESQAKRVHVTRAGEAVVLVCVEDIYREAKRDSNQQAEPPVWSSNFHHRLSALILAEIGFRNCPLVTRPNRMKILRYQC